MGVKVWGLRLGFGVWDLGFGIWGSEMREGWETVSPKISPSCSGKNGGDRHPPKQYSLDGTRRAATACDPTKKKKIKKTTPRPQHPPEKVRVTLQLTATHCNTLQHTATYYNALQHTLRVPRATHCNILQYTALYCNAL